MRNERRIYTPISLFLCYLLNIYFIQLLKWIFSPTSSLADHNPWLHSKRQSLTSFFRNIRSYILGFNIFCHQQRLYWTLPLCQIIYLSNKEKSHRLVTSLSKVPHFWLLTLSIFYLLFSFQFILLLISAQVKFLYLKHLRYD